MTLEPLFLFVKNAENHSNKWIIRLTDNLFNNSIYP